MAASLVSNFDALICALCSQNMTERTPRALDCLHTFCECCLINLPVRTMVTQARYLQCPTCKSCTKLHPHQGVSGLKLNFILTEIGNQLNLQGMTLRARNTSTACPCLEHQQELVYFCTECCVALCKDCRNTNTHVCHIECVKNYDEGLEEVAASIGLDIEEEIGLSKVWYDCINNEIPKVKDAENQLLAIGEKVRETINASVRSLQSEVIQKGHTLLGIMDSLTTSQNELAEGQKKLGDLYKIDRKEICSVIQALKLTTKSSKTKRMESTVQVPMYVKGRFFLRDINLGNISVKNIATPQKLSWNDVTSYYKYEPKLVNASDHIYIVNMDGTVSEVKYSGRCVTEVVTFIVKKIQPRRATIKTEKNIPLPYLPAAVNSLFGCNRNICLAGNDGTLCLIEGDMGRIICLNVDQVYGGIMTSQPTNKVLLVHRKDGTIVGVNNPFKNAIYAGQNSPEKEQVVEVMATGLVDPVKLTVYKEDSIFVIVGRSSHKIYILNDKMELVRSFGEFGEGEGQLNYPYDVAVTHYGTLLVADTNNYRITEYSITGEYLRTMTSFKKERERVYSLSYNKKKQQLWVVVQGQSRRLLCCEFIND